MEAQKICNLPLANIRDDVPHEQPAPEDYFPIRMVIEDVFPVVAWPGDVVYRAVKFHSERASHDSSELSE